MIAEGTQIIHSNSYMPATPKRTRFCFTLNNYTDDHLRAIRLACESRGDLIKYLIYGREVARSGTRHLQGYVELHCRKRFGGVCQLLGIAGAHMEECRGSASDNIEYCSKEDPEPFIYGEPFRTNQGRRTDLDQVAAIVKNGADAKAVLEQHGATFIKYYRGIERAIDLSSRARDYQTQVIWRYGATGAGKSRDTLRESEAFYPGQICWLPDVSLKWFNGISTNTKGVVLDEFDGTASLPYLLRVLDRYPLKVPTKGGYSEFRARIVWITSQYSPAHYYAGDMQWPALCRRLGEHGLVIEYQRMAKVEYEPEFWLSQYR